MKLPCYSSLSFASSHLTFVVVHFRYSGSNDRPANQQAVEGLCPHHEQTLANQLAAAQANSAGIHNFMLTIYGPWAWLTCAKAAWFLKSEVGVTYMYLMVLYIELDS